MLNSLNIRDIVLVDSLDLRLAPGLCVLTGETGAGKSILLDALGLATGGRGERGLVRHGAAQGIVTAEFEIGPEHAAWGVLEEQGLAADRDQGIVILRRLLTDDGRSRAFVNDQPVSITLLSRLGEMLVEVHGQHDDRGLFNASGHRQLLDSFGGYNAERDAVRNSWASLQKVTADLAEARRTLAGVKADEDYIRHNLEELQALNPVSGEEGDLASERSLMMQGEKLAESLSEIQSSLAAEGGVDATLRGAWRRLERMAGKLEGAADNALAVLERAAVETSEAMALLEELAARLVYDTAVLEALEERLFALRACARKHQVQADDLPAVRHDLEARLEALDQGEGELDRLLAEEKELISTLGGQVESLSLCRRAAAHKLDQLVNAELAPLKLEKARFQTRLDVLTFDQWGAEGGDRVEFEVSTNPGAPFGGLMKIASGGEVSRFILALKVVLSSEGSAATLVFDEVDRGVGGAVAAAVGERLARLALEAQVLVVTHSPQVAALGQHHWQITKEAGESNQVVTRVAPLGPEARREEIARMLAGAKTTDEARAAAGKLLER
jgi:DNA repair protein RecN (Recombination protein N)